MLFRRMNEPPSVSDSTRCPVCNIRLPFSLAMHRRREQTPPFLLHLVPGRNGHGVPVKASRSHSALARRNRSAGEMVSKPAPYHSPMEYLPRTFGGLGFLGLARRQYFAVVACMAQRVAVPFYRVENPNRGVL